MGLGHQVLASLYQGIHQMTLALLKFQSEGQFCILHYWLQIYIPNLRPAVNYALDQVMGESLVEAELPYHSVCECFGAFRDKSFRAAWGRIVNRRHPPTLTEGFFPIEVKWANLSYRAMLKVAIYSKDLHYGGKHGQDKHLQWKFMPQIIFARQLGFVQAILAPLITSGMMSGRPRSYTNRPRSSFVSRP